MDGDGLSSLGEKGKVKTVVDFVFSFVDQLLTRSLGLEKLPNKQQNFEILFLQINLVVKDQTTYHYGYDLNIPVSLKMSSLALKKKDYW